MRKFIFCAAAVVCSLLVCGKSTVLAFGEGDETVAIVADESGFCISGNLQGELDEDLCTASSVNSLKYETMRESSFTISDIFSEFSWKWFKVFVIFISVSFILLSLITLELKKGKGNVTYS